VRLAAPVSVLANCCFAGDTLFSPTCLLSRRIRWATHADVFNSQQVRPSGDFAEFWSLVQSDDINGWQWHRPSRDVHD